MLWTCIKVITIAAIPISTLAYAREVRHDRDRAGVWQIVERPQEYGDRQRCDFIRISRAEIRQIRRLVDDLER